MTAPTPPAGVEVHGPQWTDDAPTRWVLPLSDWLRNTGRDWKPDGTRDDCQHIPLDQPAPAVTAKSGGQWWWERPATTIAGDCRVFPPGGHIANDGRDNSRMVGRSENTIRLDLAEALILQTFRPDYPVHGNKTEKFRQVGDAVPPLLARHLLAAAIGTRTVEDAA